MVQCLKTPIESTLNPQKSDLVYGSQAMAELHLLLESMKTHILTSLAELEVQSYMKVI